MVRSSKNTFRIFMYPWFAMGHLTPYLLTANKVAARSHKIFLIIPPKAQSKLDPLNLHSDLIEFRPISIPTVEGLPAHMETRADATFLETHFLRYALDLTQPIIESLLCDLKPDFIFFDFMHWLPGLARRLQVMSVQYSVASPAALCKHSASDFEYFESAKEMGSGITMKQRLVAAICESDAIGFKACKEIEGEYCEFLEKKLKKLMLLAGPMVPKSHADLTLDQKWANWLDKFKPKTVIFCAFGSEAVLKKDQFEDLLTGLPFLIALRPPLGVDSIEEDLPDGFKERTKERGIVYGGWVPQQLILKHPSVGCFVTHCGYGSMWDGMMLDCQLVALPHEGDQYVNKGDDDGLFTKECVHGAIMATMAEGSVIGKEVRDNHDKWREFLVRKELEDSYTDNFAEMLLRLAH
ncbi:UDP-glucuronosyl and UDP-glucosyl transferase [Handroanthus impetiginosus]|uniref:Glycosyltransferase n=1 Tax=Handroanthus impetiginosus TaxID=429701 RepID=A0A2G9GLA0_9LAMI|nr:UDP-glucuronosyl and UDP-glucosyl transferase [Handroanthus impetiginosus]